MTVNFGRIYLANKMMDIPYFNAPWFDITATEIRRFVPEVVEVFNPADEDRKMGFEPMNCPNGTAEEAAKFGFNRRKTLLADWSWIAQNSDGLIIGPDWKKSTGAISEVGCHQALGLPVWESDIFFRRIAGNRPEDLFLDRWQLPKFGAIL
jgi:hypothetical protein